MGRFFNNSSVAIGFLVGVFIATCVITFELMVIHNVPLPKDMWSGYILVAIGVCWYFIAANAYEKKKAVMDELLDTLGSQYKDIQSINKRKEGYQGLHGNQSPDNPPK